MKLFVYYDKPVAQNGPLGVYNIINLMFFFAFLLFFFFIFSLNVYNTFLLLKYAYE
jgi:hypothetical protein